MRKVVDDRPDRELALHMKRGLEFARRKQVTIDAADDLHGVRGIDGFRGIGAPMHGLAVVAMAIELHDRLSTDFDLDHPAAALDFGHSLCSGFFFKPRLPRLSPKWFFG